MTLQEPLEKRAENEDVTPSEATFDSVSLTPLTVGAETEYSRRMLINASPDIEQLLRRDLASVLATAIDAAAINSTGLANKAARHPVHDRHDQDPANDTAE